MIFGAKKQTTQAATPSILKGLRVSTGGMGSVVPILFGQNRLPGHLLWYGNFTPIPHTSSQASGGKGGGAGKKTTQTTSYSYQAAVEILLCYGPIKGLYNVWDTKGAFAQQTVTENYTVPGGGGTYTVAQSSNYYDDSGVGRTDAYSVGVSDYGDIPRTLSGNYKTRITRVVAPPTVAGTYYNPTPGQYQFHSGDAGKQMSITYVYNVPDSTGTGQPTTQLSLSLFLGSPGQSAWPWMTTNHPGQDLGYSSLAYIASQNMDLGSSGSLPNYNYEIVGRNPYGAGINDSNPSDVINALLTDGLIGTGIASGFVGSLSQYSNYCIANGLFISPLIDSQRAGRDIIAEILEATNSAAFWSEGLIKIVPYGDTSVAGNGVVFQPQTSPQYDLSDDDFLDPGNTDKPIKVSIPSVEDSYNDVQVEWLNRANSYNTEPVEEKDDASIAKYGVRADSPRQFHFITTLPVATFAANAILRRNVYIRTQYEFTVGWRYVLLEPMDLVTLTDSRMGFNKLPVRITQIDEDDNGNFKIIAEEFPWGTATPTIYPKQSPTSFNPQADADPGNAIAPILYEPPARATQQSGYELWIGTAGGANWGGAEVWVSADGTNYKQIGTLFGPARMGVLTANFADSTDPDTTNTLAVDLTSSLGSISSGALADCDNFRTLCLVDNELISYQTATLTSLYHYNIGTKIRRGVFGSGHTSHASGVSKFMRIDDAVLKYSYDPQWIGQTVHFKFLSFNTVGLKKQSLANATDYPITISGIKGAIDQATGAILVGTAITNVASIDSGTSRANGSLTAANNLASGSKVGGDSGIGVAGTVFSGTDMTLQSAATTKFRLNNTGGRQWSIGSF